MNDGDLVRYSPEAWGTPLEDRPLGVITNVDTHWETAVSVPETYQMITVIFPGEDIPYSSRGTDFEVVNENW